jgi:outer membrane receptor for Fe3+-dicitrate
VERPVSIGRRSCARAQCRRRSRLWSAFFFDDRIDIGKWTITPGVRYEIIDSQQTNTLTNQKYQGDSVVQTSVAF